MSNINRKHNCPKCGTVCQSFSNLCYHMEHVHGMWYLNKNARLTSVPLASYEARRVPTTHSDNSSRHRVQDTQDKLDVQASIYKLSQSYSRLEHDVKLIFEELRKKKDFLKEEKDFQYSRVNDVATSPPLFDSSGEIGVPRPEFQLHPCSEESKAFNKMSPISFVRDNKDVPSGSVVDCSSYDGYSTPLQILKVPKQYRHKNACCTICRSGACSFDSERTLIHSGLFSKLNQKLDPGSLPSLHGHHSVSSHGGHCQLEENTMCKQLLSSTQESRADSGKGDSVKSKVTSAKVMETAEHRPLPLESKHSSHRHSPEVEDGFHRKQDLSPGEILQDNLVTSNVTREDTNPLALVFAYLSTNDLLTCRMVCRSWRQLAQQPCYYENVVISERIVTSELLLSIAESCCDTKFLTLKDLRGREKRDDETAERYLRQMRGRLEIGLEAVFKSAERTLTTLNIVSCGNLLTERCLWLASCYTRKLTQVAYISQLHPAAAESLWAFGSGCRKVRTLIIPPLYPSPKPERFSSRSLHMIAKCWPNLRTLCIGGTEVGVDGLVSIASNCHRLEVLELDHMGEVQESAIISICKSGLRALQKIYFTHTPVTPAALLHLYSACRHLTAICIILDPSDYFLNPRHPPNVQEFENKISAIKDLLEQPGLSDVLKITVK